MSSKLTTWLQFSENDFLGPLSRTEAVVYWTAILTPVWWLLGIQTLFYPAVIFGLLLPQFSWHKLMNVRLPTCVWAWAAMVLTAGITAALGLAQIGLPLVKIAASGVTLFKGYGLITAAFLLPFWVRVRLKVVTRAVTWMTAGYSIAIVLLFLLLFAGIWTEPIVPVLAKVIPGDKQSLHITPAAFQRFFGVLLPRTALYMPDPPIPGICGVLSFFVCWGESNKRLRALGWFGSLSALLVSQSRLAWLTFPMVVMIALCFRCFPARQTSLWGAALVNSFCAVLGISVADLAGQAKAVFTSARAESSSDRELVVGETIKAWLEKPLLGWGLPRGSVQWHIYDIVLGSFSTYASVLYLHGVVGFVVFLTALSTTLAAFLPGAWRGDAFCQRAFAAMFALCALIEGLPLSWVCVYAWFFFLWMGAVLVERSPQPVRPHTWEQLIALQQQRSYPPQPEPT